VLKKTRRKAVGFFKDNDGEIRPITKSSGELNRKRIVQDPREFKGVSPKQASAERRLREDFFKKMHPTKLSRHLVAAPHADIAFSKSHRFSIGDIEVLDLTKPTADNFETIDVCVVPKGRYEVWAEEPKWLKLIPDNPRGPTKVFFVRKSRLRGMPFTIISPPKEPLGPSL